jgi:hypothetical protein
MRFLLFWDVIPRFFIFASTLNMIILQLNHMFFFLGPFSWFLMSYALGPIFFVSLFFMSFSSWVLGVLGGLETIELQTFLGSCQYPKYTHSC